MRTTLTLDDDVLAKARQLAHDSGQSLGTVISELARRSISSTPRSEIRNGIRLLPVIDPVSQSTLEEVNHFRDETP